MNIYSFPFVFNSPSLKGKPPFIPLENSREIKEGSPLQRISPQCKTPKNQMFVTG